MLRAQSVLAQTNLSAEVRVELEAILALLGTLEAPHFVEARGALHSPLILNGQYSCKLVSLHASHLN